MTETDIVYKKQVESSFKKARNNEELMNAVQGFLKDLGINGFHYQPSLDITNIVELLTTLPKEYLELYSERELLAHDLLMEHAYCTKKPIFGSQVYNYIQDAPFETMSIIHTKLIQKMDEEYNIYESLVIPIHPHRNKNDKKNASPEKSEVAAFTVYNVGESPENFQEHAKKK